MCQSSLHRDTRRTSNYRLGYCRCHAIYIMYGDMGCVCLFVSRQVEP